MNGYSGKARLKRCLAMDDVEDHRYSGLLNGENAKLLGVWKTWNSLKTIVQNFFAKAKRKNLDRHRILYLNGDAWSFLKTDEGRLNLKNIYGMTCNGGFSLPKTNADICRQECIEKRMVNSRSCCQPRRARAVPPSGQSCQSCPPHFAPPAPSPPPLHTSCLTYQAEPPPQHCPPPCPPRPPCPPTISTPLKCSDYLHTTTECFPNSKTNPSRWDNTTCYNEGNDVSGNTIRQWNTRCQFANKTPNEYFPHQRSTTTTVGPTTSATTTRRPTTDATTGSNNPTNHHNHSSCYSRDQCRLLRSTAADHCFRKCKKELMIHFPSGKCGTEPQLRRLVGHSNGTTPTAKMATSARSNMSIRSNSADECENKKFIITKSPKVAATSTMAATTGTTTTTARGSTAANTTRKSDRIAYRTQISLADDNIVPANAPAKGHSDRDIFSNRASHLRWLENKRKLRVYFPAKSSLIEPVITNDFYKNDVVDWRSPPEVNITVDATSSYLRKKADQQFRAQNFSSD